jgi:hypothetical protein
VGIDAIHAHGKINLSLYDRSFPFQLIKDAFDNFINDKLQILFSKLREMEGNSYVDKCKITQFTTKVLCK